MTREVFLKEIEALKTDIVRMATMAGASIHASVEALRERDTAWAARIIADDDKIDTLHLELEERCMRLLARQQPMASDLPMVRCRARPAYRLGTKGGGLVDATGESAA